MIQQYISKIIFIILDPEQNNKSLDFKFMC